MKSPWRAACAAWIALMASAARLAAAEARTVMAGAARVDVTPPAPVMLMGYASRASSGPSTNAAQRLHARALALGEGERTAVVVTVDQCILPGTITGELRRRLREKAGLGSAQVAFTVTHTHSAPCLTGAAPNILGRAFTEAEQAGIDAYTGFFVEGVERAVLEALRDRRPSQVAWGQGRVGFARNRRTAGGPVDHDLPVLRVRSMDGTLRAAWANYACHCTTMGGELNASHGDWAGVAAMDVEASAPGAVALVSIGCGADANPEPRGSVALAERHGRELAAEMRRLMALPMTPLGAVDAATMETVELPFRGHFTREEWERRAAAPGIVGHHARRWLGRIGRGEVPAPTLPYPVQTWAFSTNLAVVFLGGEVVVDYALRLKRELDGRRLWVTAYANDVPGYIPSRRILAEGGYEAETSLWYYDRPQQFDPALEDKVVDAVRRPLAGGFKAAAVKGEMTEPMDARRALEAFSLPGSLVIELVAGDNLVQSPVAIDFGADGRLWVAEMTDYPMGEGGGRVKVLEDIDRDGIFDRARVVASGLPFPTGVMAWRDGVLACAAPDVWWVAGDGSRREALLTGFATHNYQARVNGLRWGLDGWVHGAGGLFGGKITSARTGRVTDATGRDFRFVPDTGAFEALPGVSQQGRPRDDFGEWFGNDNGSLLWSFPMPPAAAALGFEPPRAALPANRDGSRVHPTSRTLERFNDPHTANHLTSACGPEILRGTGLGGEHEGDAFVCEPVHNLVRRARLSRDGVGFAATRAETEKASEFLASTDHWFRPVEVRTGTDGCLWVVDMQRFVIEHPRWISPDRLARLDVRAGAERGRIYRVRSRERRAGPLPRVGAGEGSLDPLAALASAEGPLRDHGQQRLMDLPEEARRGAARAVEGLLSHGLAPVRAQALWTLQGMGRASDERVRGALRDADERVRWSAMDVAFVRGMGVGDGMMAGWEASAAARFRMALLMGREGEPGAARLAALATRHPGDEWVGAVAARAARRHGAAFARRLAMEPGVLARHGVALEGWLAGWALDGASALEVIAPALGEAAREDVRVALPWFVALGGGEDAAEQRLPGAMRALMATWGVALGGIAAEVIGDGKRPEAQRVAAARMACRRAAGDGSMDAELVGMMDGMGAGAVMEALVQGLSRLERAALAERMTLGLDGLGATARDARLRVLLSRRGSARVLAGAVAAGAVSPGSWTLEQREALRERGGWKGAGAGPRGEAVREGEGRAGVVRRYAAAAGMRGDRGAGRLHFERLCASCHALGGHGHAVGPDMASYRGKAVEDFVLAVLDPNAAVDARHRTRRVELKDGRELAGLVVEETAGGFVLVQPGGVRERIGRGDVVRVGDVASSLMPEGFEAALTVQGMADLAAWVRAVPRGFGTATESEARASRERWRSMGASAVGGFRSDEATLPYGCWLGRQSLRVCRQDTGTSRVAWESRPVPGGRLHRWPVAMGFASQPRGKFVLRAEGLCEVEFDVALEDAEWEAEGGLGRLRYRVEERNGEDSNGAMELEFAEGVAPGAGAVRISVTGTPAGSPRWFGIYEVRE